MEEGRASPVICKGAVCAWEYSNPPTGGKRLYQQNRMNKWMKWNECENDASNNFSIICTCFEPSPSVTGWFAGGCRRILMMLLTNGLDSVERIFPPPSSSVVRRMFSFCIHSSIFMSVSFLFKTLINKTQVDGIRLSCGVCLTENSVGWPHHPVSLFASAVVRVPGGGSFNLFQQRCDRKNGSGKLSS